MKDSFGCVAYVSLRLNAMFSCHILL